MYVHTYILYIYIYIYISAQTARTYLQKFHVLYGARMYAHVAILLEPHARNSLVCRDFFIQAREKRKKFVSTVVKRNVRNECVSVGARSEEFVSMCEQVHV